MYLSDQNVEAGESICIRLENGQYLEAIFDSHDGERIYIKKAVLYDLRCAGNESGSYGTVRSAVLYMPSISPETVISLALDSIVDAGPMDSASAITYSVISDQLYRYKETYDANILRQVAMEQH